MRRSLLFIPANNPGMLQSSDVFNADSIVFDLEDAVFVRDKDAARTLLREYLKSIKDTQSEIIVRINDEKTPFHSTDLGLLRTGRIDTIMLPKATAASFYAFSERLERFEEEHSLSRKVSVIPIIESALGLIEAHEIASHERVSGLFLGAEDLATDLMAERTKAGYEILYARSRLVISARAFGIDAIDTPFTDTRDEQGLIDDTRSAKSLGMNAKAAIHPDQVHVINRIHSPSRIEIEFAQKVLAKHEQLAKGSFSIDGKMIDRPIIERAKRTLASARRWGMIE
ncbi:MAG: HpcH/HpaI aldolase/citrate lyase family protein [Acholeplasmataceae bacterium]